MSGVLLTPVVTAGVSELCISVAFDSTILCCLLNVVKHIVMLNMELVRGCCLFQVVVVSAR